MQIESLRYIELFNQSPIATELYDSNGILLDVNQACINLFGLVNPELLKGFYLFSNPHLTEQAIQDLRAGLPVRYELTYDFELVKSEKLFDTSRSGICQMECFINQILDSQKQLAGYAVHLTDITERKKIEQELDKSNFKFRQIVESAISGLCFYRLEDTERLILTGANRSANQIFGFSLQPYFGKTIDEIFPALSNTETMELFKQIAKGELGPKEIEIRYADERINGYFQIQIFQTEKDNIGVLFVDTSEKKKYQQILEDDSKRLQELNLNKDKFLSIIAHDLRNPFNAIIGFADLMLKDLDEFDKESLSQGLSTISSAAHQANKLLDNLLTWAQNQTGRLKFNPEKMNLSELISSSLGPLESSAIKKEITLKINVKKTYTVFADKNMINFILRNLISNAIKFSYRGGKIKISAGKTDEEIRISVSDSGIGISAEKLSLMFNIENHTTTLGTEDEQGTGLGLVLCKDFVEKHNGKIWAESIRGKGSTFTFSLPLTKT